MSRRREKQPVSDGRISIRETSDSVKTNPATKNKQVDIYAEAVARSYGRREKVIHQ